MDDQLKKDIHEKYGADYYQAARQRRTGFWKALTNMNDKMEAALGKIDIQPFGAALLLTATAFITAIPLGILAATAVFTHGALTGKANRASREEAKADIDRDIDSGVLTEKYKTVLDARIGDLQKQVEHYTQQKAQLPEKGAAAAAFAEAVANTPADGPAAPVPVPPAATRSL